MAGVTQLPVGMLLEQNDAGVNVLPLQEDAAQPTVAGCCRQAPPPLQKPVLPQVPFAGHLLCGSATLAGTLAQAPRLPATLQAWQVPQLLLPQQTPSRQVPLLHSCPPTQATPFALTGRQLPFAPVQ